jgi:hypothetical protein
LNGSTALAAAIATSTVHVAPGLLPMWPSSISQASGPACERMKETLSASNSAASAGFIGVYQRLSSE